MSHYIAEVVTPPSDHVEDDVEQVMNSLATNDESSGQPCDWYDYFRIGGRFTGHKLEQAVSPTQLDAFVKLLNERRITVSAVRFGKETLKPAEQIPVVDALWREYFPGTHDQCPLFDHAKGFRDSWTVAEVSAKCPNLTAARIIVAGPHWEDKNKLQAVRMLTDSFWNGVEWQDTRFDGRVMDALNEMLEDSKAEHPVKNRIAVTGDWLITTVDYHN